MVVKMAIHFCHSVIGKALSDQVISFELLRWVGRKVSRNGLADRQRMQIVFGYIECQMG